MIFSLGSINFVDAILCDNYERDDGKIVCLSESTAQKLIERGWELTPTTKDAKIIIHTGVWSGLCMGYCSHNFTITSEKITYDAPKHTLQYAQMPVMFPAIHKEVFISTSDWIDLTHLVDVKIFNSLPDSIGSPGETDAAIHWIEISANGKTKRTSFEFNDRIPEITDLRKKLDEITILVYPIIYNFDQCVDAGNTISQSFPHQCITSDGLIFTKTSIDTSDECLALGFKIITAQSLQMCITTDRQFVSKID